MAGRRWTVEEDFQAAKGLAGLDEHQVRRWDSWYRWTTLAMLAAAFLTITAAAERARSPAPDGQIPLTRNEIGHLLTTLITSQRQAPGTACAGPPGDAATSTAPDQPLPAASPPAMKITNSGWSTRRPERPDGCAHKVFAARRSHVAAFQLEGGGCEQEGAADGAMARAGR